MASRCQVTGAEVGFGASVSHSHRRTNRRWTPNVQRKKYFVPSLGRTVSLDVSARGIRTIDRRGIESVVAAIRARGERV